MPQLRIHEKTNLHPNYTRGLPREFLKAWDVVSGTASVHPLEGHTKGVWSLTSAPFFGLVFSGSDDCTIRVWDVKTMQCLKV